MKSKRKWSKKVCSTILASALLIAGVAVVDGKADKDAKVDDAVANATITGESQKREPNLSNSFL